MVTEDYKHLTELLYGKRVGFKCDGTFAPGKTAFLQGKIIKINEHGVVIEWDTKLMTVPIQSLVYIGNPKKKVNHGH